MQVDSENCTMSFVGQFLEVILINEGNIAENCQKIHFSFCVTFILRALLVHYWQNLIMLHIKIHWYKVYTNSMFCWALRDKNTTPPLKFVKLRIFGDLK
jgi:hypothetical protein